MSASEIIPELGQIVWRHKRKEFQRADPKIVTARFSYRLAAENYEVVPGRRSKFHRLKPWRWRWRAEIKREDIQFVSKALVLFVEVMPKVGPLRTLQFKPPTVRVQDLFIEAFDVSVVRYEADLSGLPDGQLILKDDNLDIGRPARATRYSLADETYAHLLNGLAKHRFRNLTPELRENILAYYSNLNAPAIAKAHPRKWKRTLLELSALRSAPVETRIASH